MKRIISFLLALVLCFTISATAFAELPDSLDGQNEVIMKKERVLRTLLEKRWPED